MCGTLIWKAVKFRIKAEIFHRKQILLVLGLSFLRAFFFFLYRETFERCIGFKSHGTLSFYCFPWILPDK